MGQVLLPSEHSLETEVRTYGFLADRELNANEIFLSHATTLPMSFEEVDIRKRLPRDILYHQDISRNGFYIGGLRGDINSFNHESF